MLTLPARFAAVILCFAPLFFHVWTAPSMQGLCGVVAPRSGAVMCPASMCGTHDRGP